CAEDPMVRTSSLASSIGRDSIGVISRENSRSITQTNRRSQLLDCSGRRKRGNPRRMSAVIEQAEGGVVITNHGRPAAILIDARGYDMEDALAMVNPRFWAEIAKGRKGRSYSLEEARRRLGLPRPARRRRPRKRSGQ